MEGDFEQRLRAAQLTALAEFAAGAGHEINNPVATITGRVQLLLADETNPERRQALAVIGAQALRIRDMIGDAMLFARPPEPRPELLDLAKLVPETLAPLVAQGIDRGIALTIEVPESSPLTADRTQLAVLLIALVRNAIEAIDRDGIIRVTVTHHTEEDVHFTRLFVDDDGPGLVGEQRERAFDPFYSGRQAGRGLGFGLPKCWRILQVHGGRIEIDSSPEGGCRFVVDIPVSYSPR